MAEKYYAVKKGKMPGIYETWEECKSSVNGYPGAEYKSFKRLEEANDYLGGMGNGQLEQISRNELHLNSELPLKREGKTGLREEQGTGAGEVPEPGTLLAYVDGSYDDALKKYAFGCVFISPDGREETAYGNGDKEQSLQHRNVTGEMLGAMYAVKVAMLNGFSKVEIRYDYQGIEKWVTGEWRSKTELTGKYARAMRQWEQSIDIVFTKVVAHTNVYYNELADKMAKEGLRKGNGIPGILRLTGTERDSDKKDNDRGA